MTIGWNLFIPNQMHKIINKLACLAGAAQLLLLSVQSFAVEAATALPATGTASGAAGAGAIPPARPSMIETIMPFLLMFGVMYFLILRPQQKKMKEQQAMLSALTAGDAVVTTAGILGTVREISEKIIGLEIANNVQIKVLRSQISQKLKNGVQDIS